MVFITGRQFVAARALAGWTRDDLGRKAKITAWTVTRLEQAGTGVVKCQTATLQAVLRAFESVKIRFTDTGGVDFVT